MSDEERDAYVNATLALHGFDLAAGDAERVALQFARIAAIAQSFVHLPFVQSDEPAPVFRL